MQNTKHFCLMPWTHMHVWPNGNTYMCCVSDSNSKLGVLSDRVSLLDLWNSERMRENRLKMLGDEPVQECSRCYEIERSGGTSQRVDHNSTFKHHMHKISDTKPDGTVDRINMPYMDIRFSNICNLKCRTCGPELSSKWFEDAKKLGLIHESNRIAIQSPDINNETLWEQLVAILDSVEIVYFAGGEPILTEEHYRILKLLLDNGKTDIELRYNTNFTVLRYKDMHIFDMWNKFKKVTVGASIDGYGDRLEYIRKESSWDQIQNNREEMIKKCPHVNFYINFTLSVFNFSIMHKLHKMWIENEYIRPEDFNINFLTYPLHYKINIASSEERFKIIEEYKEHIQWMKELGVQNETIYDRWGAAIIFLSEEYNETEKKKFIELTTTIDGIRTESFIDTFPELNYIYE